MGFFRGSLCSTVACCFGSAFCSLCCSACPSCKGSTSTRLVYSLMLVTGLIISCILILPILSDELIQSPHLCDNSTSTNDCPDVIGSRAVYRVSFGMAIFFCLLSLLMIRVKTSNYPRAKIQNGFWGFKLFILAGIIGGSFFIPAKEFDFVLMIFGLIGGFFFILIQFFLSIDFVHTWNESWVDQVETGSKKHGYGLLFCTFLFYALVIIAIGLLYIFYAEADCLLHKFFVLFNMALCVVLSIVSISPRVRAYNSSCGLLQSSFVSLYVLYFTWSAMSNHPNEYCNSTPVYNSSSARKLSNPITILGLIMLVLALVYSMITSSRNNRMRKLFLCSITTDAGLLDDAQMINSVADDKWILSSNADYHQRVYDDECGSVTYNYSLFHLMLLLATLYAMMTLTNWDIPRDTIKDYGKSLPALWVKIISSWICVLLYIWSCIAPAVFPEREFS